MFFCCFLLFVAGEQHDFDGAATLDAAGTCSLFDRLEAGLPPLGFLNLGENGEYVDPPWEIPVAPPGTT